MGLIIWQFRITDNRGVQEADRPCAIIKQKMPDLIRLATDVSNRMILRIVRSDCMRMAHHILIFQVI